MSDYQAGKDQMTNEIRLRNIEVLLEDMSKRLKALEDNVFGDPTEQSEEKPKADQAKRK